MLKQILGVFITLLGLLFVAATVFAQSEQEIAKKYGIAFPVAELGNCTGVAECKTFCDNSTNRQVCTDFGKKHNLSSSSSKSSTAKSDAEILKLARVELGCSTHDECMAFCEQETNMEKCIDFAARHNLLKDASQMKQQMSTLKNLLGCNSMKACMDFCNNPTNMENCMEVFKQAGFLVEAGYSGPGGCNSEQSCRTYCEENPKECGKENYQSEPPEIWCAKVSSDCKWDGQSCTCGGAYSPQESGEAWCPKAGPGCKWSGTTCECSGQNYIESPPPGTDPTEWCNQNPGECMYQNQDDSTSECAKYGCTFDGKTCQCSTTSSDKVDFSSQCLSQPGCSWNATTKICSCPSGESASTSTSDPGNASYECEKLGGVWDGIDCRSKSSQVQGASTNPSLLQQILDFILRK